MRLNIASSAPLTAEGAPAKHLTPVEQLRRSVMSCLLWESEFYESGQDIGARLAELVGQVAPDDVVAIALEARERMHLRHAPLLLAAALTRRLHGTPDASKAGDLIGRVIQRADELGEFLAQYMTLNGIQREQLPKHMAHQVKRGLRLAFPKFDRFQLGRYSSEHRKGEIRPIDVLRLVHPKPASAEQSALWRDVAKGAIEPPDTWEVQLSRGADKRETFERLLRENRLGYLALLRNVRGMLDAGVAEKLIHEAILARRGAHRVLPFRYVAAARAAPRLEPWIDQALQAAIGDGPAFSGLTLVLVDVSGSMDAKLSARSDLTRADAAAALASLIRGRCRVFTFSTLVVEVPPRSGMAGIDAVLRSQPHGSTLLGQAVTQLNAIAADRLIVVTDEQSHDRVPDPVHGKAFMVNVASAKNGVGYRGRWLHCDGWSENIIRWIVESERMDGSSGSSTSDPARAQGVDDRDDRSLSAVSS